MRREIMTLAARIGGAILLFVALCALTPGMTRAASPATPTAEAKHCVVVIAPRTAEDRAAHRSSQVKHQGCFATQEEKEAALTAWFGPQRPAATYLLIRFWRDADQGGGPPLELFSETGCDGYYSANLADWGWDDIASSAEPHCGRAMRLWENPGLTGASLYMGSYFNYLGALNDAVSSWETAN